MEAASASDMDLGAPDQEISQELKRSRHEPGRDDLTMQEAQQMTDASAFPPGNLTGEQNRAPSRIGAAPGYHAAGERDAAAAGGELTDLAMNEANAAQLARAKAFHHLYTTSKLKYEYTGQELPPFVGVVPHLQEHLQDGDDNHYDAYVRLCKLDNGHRVLTAEQYTLFLKELFAKELSGPGEEIQGVSSRTARQILSGRGLHALEKRLEALSISRRRPGPNDPYETEEQQQTFLRSLELEEQQALKAAEELGWQPYQNKSRELDVLAKAEFWLTRLNTFAPNAASLTLRSNLLSFFEQVGVGLVAGAHGAEMDEFEREARVHACGTIVKQIQ
eukprot:2112358-Rhodomonas_salina.1